MGDAIHAMAMCKFVRLILTVVMSDMHRSW
jgi:hypothetical protein